MTIENEIIEDIMCEIKGLMVNIDGQPNRYFCTPEEVDIFIDEIEKVIKPEILAIRQAVISEMMSVEELNNIIDNHTGISGSIIRRISRAIHKEQRKKLGGE